MAYPLNMLVLLGISVALVSCVIEDCTDFPVRFMPNGEYVAEQVEGPPLSQDSNCEIEQVDTTGPTDDVIVTLICNGVSQKETWKRHKL